MNKEQQIEEMAREIAKRSCHLFENCPKPIKHNCISQDPEIMLESSKNYVTVATWLVEEGYRKESETVKELLTKIRDEFKKSGILLNFSLIAKQYGVEIE
ncbi:MAG: hypothetical protein IJH34_07555 [Romboutsia sp.]|nr:hypothetical protein [Romboutsia sp.]